MGEVKHPMMRQNILFLPFSSILLNAGKFFELELSSLCWNFSACGCGQFKEQILQPSSIWTNSFYVKFYASWFWVTLAVVVPVLSVTILTGFFLNRKNQK